MTRLAYRMLGSWSEAEDIVQDAFFRWRSVSRDKVEHPQAYLMKTVTHLCIDVLRKRKIDKLNYTGPWIPEPLEPTFESRDPSESMESLGLGLLFLLERLSPLERAVFVLREAFDLEHQELAEILRISSQNSRQLLRRARNRLSLADQPQTLGFDGVEEIMSRFCEAMATGDFEQLGLELSEQVEAYTDGGGKASAARIPLLGIERVTTVLGHVMRKHRDHFSWTSGRVNGEPALLGWEDGSLASVTLIQGHGRVIHRILIIRNPDKLRRYETALKHSD
ncbi:MAG: sigma-70 family RNA polymerase sigma factor [Pseudomonadales bacterium]|nr:sigma-70 family RNA polymerase sigma factor [Pseudomonadales bacterium]